MKTLSSVAALTAVRRRRAMKKFVALAIRAFASAANTARLG